MKPAYTHTNTNRTKYEVGHEYKDHFPKSYFPYMIRHFSRVYRPQKCGCIV